MVAVHPDAAGLYPLSELERLVDVVGPDGGGEAVHRLVGDLERFLLVLEGDDGEHRAEDLLLGYLHAVVHLIEDGGLVVVALVVLVAGEAPAALD